MPLAGGYTTNNPGGFTGLPGGGYRLTPRETAPPGTTPTGPDDAGKKAADQLANPAPVDIKTETNPYQKEAYGDAKKFADSLADRSNASITNAMQRTRDVGAAAISDAAAASGRRGGAPGSGLSQVLTTREAQKNQQQVAKTNADLTDVALNREQAARALEMGGSTDIASEMNTGFRNQADLYLGRRRADLDQAGYYSDERDRRFERARKIAEMALGEGQDPSFLGGGGGGGSISPGGIGGDSGRSSPIRGTGGMGGGGSTGGGSGTGGMGAGRSVGATRDQVPYSNRDYLPPPPLH